MLKELPVTVFGLNVLITGYGRIGEVMARMLMALGARVSVYARREEQLAKAECIGCSAVTEAELEGMIYEVLSKQAQVILNVADLSNAGSMTLKLLVFPAM